MEIPKNQRCKDKFSHSFFGNTCEWCGISQREISEKKITKIQPIIIKKKNINSEAQLAVNDLMEYFKEDVYKKGAFAKYAHAYKVLGKHNILSFLSYCREKGINSPAYFWGMYRNKYREIKTSSQEEAARELRK